MNFSDNDCKIMTFAKSLSKKRLSIVFTFATSLATLSLLKLTVLQRRNWDGGGSLEQLHSEENLLEKVQAMAIAMTMTITITMTMTRTITIAILCAIAVKMIARRNLRLCQRCSGLTIGLRDSGSRMIMLDLKLLSGSRLSNPEICTLG